MPGGLIQPAHCLPGTLLREQELPECVFRKVIFGLCGQAKPPLRFFMISHGGEVIPVELSQLMRRHRVSFRPELFQRPDGFGVFFVQRIDILQDRFGGTIASSLFIYAVGLLLLMCRFRLILHLLIFKSREAEADVLGLPDNIVFDPAELFLLRERELLPRCAAAIALVQLIPDLIPSFIALRHFRLLGQLIHDGVHQCFERFLQIAILLLPGGGFQRLHQLAHLFLDDGVVAELMLHLLNHLPHGILRRFDQLFIGNILPLVDLDHLIPEDGVGQLGAHGRNAFPGQEALLRIV